MHEHQNAHSLGLLVGFLVVVAGSPPRRRSSTLIGDETSRELRFWNITTGGIGEREQAEGTPRINYYMLYESSP